MKQVKKILVTGGSGFIGSNFIRHLHMSYPDYTIYNLDLLTYAGNQDNLLDVELVESPRPPDLRRYFFIQGDICDPQFIDEIFNKYSIDVVVNFAAESHVDRSITNDYHFFRTNLMGVQNLVAFVKKHSIPRFIQVSTDEIYGDIENGTSREHHAMRPSNPYAASKAAADLVVQSYMRTHQLPLLIVRGSNNFGPYQYPEKLIPLAITNLLENKVIPIHGDGSQKRRWIHVSDFCKAIDLVMHRAKDFSIYNVSGLEMTNIDIVRDIARTLRKDPELFLHFIDDRPGGDKRYAPDSSKIEKELAWNLIYPIRNHLPQVTQWYKENTDWWKKVKGKEGFQIYYEKQFRSEY